MNRPFALALLMATIVPFAAPATAQAPDNSIYFGNVKLTLGESQQSVIAKLAERYRVADTHDPAGEWVVQSCDNQPTSGVNVPTACHGHSIGLVGFKNGRLSSVSNDTPVGDDHLGVDFAHALYWAIDDLPKRSGDECVSTTQESDRMFERKTILLGCGSRKVRIDITRFVAVGKEFENADRRETATVSEVLQTK